MSTESTGMPAWAKIGLVLLTLASVVVFLLLNSEAGDAFTYSRSIEQVLADAPGDGPGRRVRVEGTLRQGSIQFREEPCEWRFVIEANRPEGSAEPAASLPVRFPQCVVPDTFRDGFGISVTVRGRLEDDRVFLADEVVPRCPSKYEMNERLEAGEEMPHDLAPTPRASAIPDLGLDGN